jgi:hypothetical protein
MRYELLPPSHTSSFTHYSIFIVCIEIKYFKTKLNNGCGMNSGKCGASNYLTSNLPPTSRQENHKNNNTGYGTVHDTTRPRSTSVSDSESDPSLNSQPAASASRALHGSLASAFVGYLGRLWLSSRGSMVPYYYVYLS